MRKHRRSALGDLQLCYEAGPCGYAAQRAIRAPDASCVLVAPSLVPRKPGERAKTDRRDARKLAALLRAGLLTEVHPPTEADATCSPSSTSKSGFVPSTPKIEQTSLDPRYASVVAALRCFPGIDTLTAMRLVAELHDFMRFESARGPHGLPRTRPLRAFLGRQGASRRDHQGR